MAVFMTAGRVQAADATYPPSTATDPKAPILVTPIHTTHPEVFSGISGPGHPVVGTGYGGYRSGREGTMYCGDEPAKPGWLELGDRARGTAVRAGLIPPLRPIWEVHLRDTIINQGGDGFYYMTGSTGDNIWDATSGIELWRSADLKKWDYLGLVWSMVKDATWEKNTRYVWAPEIHYVRGDYYLAYCVSGGQGGGTGILKSSSGKPEGPYVYALASGTRVGGGIDATLFEDDDGSVYFTSGGAGAIRKMKPDLSDFDGPAHAITYEKPADGSWTRNTIAMEGASLFKHDGIYYLGGAGFYQGRYSSLIARSTNIFGPYEHWQEAVPCGGGGNYFKGPDGCWYCTYFGNDEQSAWREKPGMVRIDFAADGAIKIADEQPAFLLQAGAATKWRTETNGVYDVHHFGATGDGATLDTKALQSAIDQCSAQGGGTVLVAGGRFVTGTLYLKSGVDLRVDAGAMILGSTNIADYATNTDRTMYNEPYMNRCLIFAKDAQDITIEGQGIIDGRGKSFPNKGDGAKNRPKMFRLLRCSHIQVRDITLQSPASWTTEWRYCHDIAVDNLTIASRYISNGDGLDFDGCTKVRVNNSNFNTGDDSICLQTSLTNQPCHDFVIAGCNFSSRWAGIRIGLLSRGDFSDVMVTNCTFKDHNDSGLKIQMNEGGEMKDMTFTHLTMTNVPRPLFLTFCQKNAWVDADWNELPPMKRVSNLRFTDITADSTVSGKNFGFVIVGRPGHPVENIVLDDIHATFPGGATAADVANTNAVAELTPENLGNRWPEIGSLRRMVPARGLYARHVKGLTIHNVEFTTKTPDARPDIVLDDVDGIEGDR